MSRLRVAVIGCGIGRSHITEGYLSNASLFEAAALCDLDPRRMDDLGDAFGIARRETSLDVLLADDGIDVIDICTPPSVHYEQILKSLAAGKHVVCEKPLVGSLADLDAVMAAEAEAAGRLMPIFQYRFGDGIARVKAILEAGIAGKPYVGTAETFWRRGADYYAVPWRGKWKTELGGVLMGHAIHIHDLMNYLMGPIAGVFGRVATRVNPIEVEDCVSASCLMESGALVSLTATLGNQDEISRLRLCFENVTFESDHAPYSPGAKPWTIIPANEAVAAQIDALLADWQPVAPRFETQMRLFHEAIATGGPLPVTSADARRALELVTAFYHSAETRSEVTLPIGPDHPKYRSWLPAGA
ncbi:Gfo/Idh/MocA family oxidoreductase [Arsenicitalea aurantiaca]|uniref:Gfo/Idh/MocA family oxidoreductase n=1 Tax=Arsenicitalea aurantiaca TaxID=1783274 RepID=A0A433X7L3_9HYPH|nr:Gfo/Idh/MocA family oxidoreductase [Arsenicitalea aurantiaca]RUT30045.1 Gfo/Idh/MocA family oxidoreductase [Arsenicitalea aurantiaca]